MSVDLSMAVLAAAAPAPQETNPMITLVMFGGLFLFMYLLIIRPQRKRQKEHKNLTSSLSKGDEVVLTSGLLGKIVDINDDYLVIAAGENVQLKFQRVAVHAVLPKGTIKSI